MTIRTNGWLSRGRAYNEGGIATADIAQGNFSARLKGLREKGVPLWDDPEEQDIERARKTVEWAEALTEEELQSDYLYNLHTVLKNGSLRAKQFGIAASGIFAYGRAMEKELERQERETERASRVDEFAGEKGERKIFEFTVFRRFDYDGYNGDGYSKHILRDDEGRTLIWNTGKMLDEGDRYRGKFTVKELKEHDKYGKQTQITRPHGLERIGD
jgi:hypothetical protein